MGLDLKLPYTLIGGKNIPSVFIQGGVSYRADGSVLGPAPAMIEAKKPIIVKGEPDLPPEPEVKPKGKKKGK